MKLVKKISAAVLLCLAALGLLICIAGLVGTWIVNVRLSDVVVDTIETVEGYFAAVDGTLGRLQSGFASQHQHVSRVRVELADASLSDAVVLRALIDRIVSDDQNPAAENLINTTVTIADGVLAFNSALVTINNIPGINLPTLTEELEAVKTRVDTFQRDLETLRNDLSASEDVKNRLLQTVERMEDGLNQVETGLAEGKTKITSARASISSLGVTVPRVINLASVALSVLFILFGAGQALLLDRAWKWFRSISLTRSRVMPGPGDPAPSGSGEEVPL